MILRPVRPASPCGPPISNRPVGIDEILGADQHGRRQHRLDDLVDHGLRQRRLLLVHARMVLRRQHDGVDRDRLAVDVAHRDLGLGVRPQPRQAAVLPDLALPLHEPVRVVDRERHQRRRLVAGVAEHHALVAGALVQVLVGSMIDAARDVGRLPPVAHHHRAAVGVEAQLRVVVADPADHGARDSRVVVLDGRGDFAGEHDEAGRHQRFRGHAPGRILL